MTTLKRYKEELTEKLRDKEYRDAFVSSHINNGLPFQIRALREQRVWTQEQVAKISNKKQETICRLENPNYGNYTLGTLKEIASAFDVALVVRFVPFGELIEWDINLSSDSLEVVSFDEDPYFQEDRPSPHGSGQQYTIMPTTAAANNEVAIADLISRKVDIGLSPHLSFAVKAYAT
ncbi:MAG: helix-turn-helix transcriptional regulator [Thermodesulfovibrionales bacterium]|jgi:transcriptional regulator with XRE-family HTH domain